MTNLEETAVVPPVRELTTRPAQPSGYSRVLRRLVLQREIGVIIALGALCAYGAIATSGFARKENLLNVGQQVSLIGMMAVGMTFVIITGEIDLSVGSIYALASMVTALMLSHGVYWGFAILGGLGVGAGCGLVNGFLTVLFRIPSFIVTLGTLSVFEGMALLITNAAPISLDQTKHNIAQFSYLGEGKPFGIPMQLLLMLAVVLVGGFVLRFTKFGYHVYAVGGSREAARLCGIPVDRIRILSFVIVGVLSALAGIAGLSFLLYVSGDTGTGLELLVITAVIIGGTALFGGSGTMLGTLVGVFLIGALQNVLILAQVASFWQTVVVGVVIVAAVAFDSWLRRRSDS
ncbi:MAG TPA: ABC transporter permease [Gaiellaceae bacterium]|nr:ABC transporter permease [Gaiellaceae bacterium]